MIDRDDDKVYEAIRQGVDSAIWRMITNATNMPCSDFFDAVQRGVAIGIEKAANAGAFDKDDAE